MANIKAMFYDDLDQFEAAGPGAIMYLDGSALIKCPGCGRESCCTERRGENHPSWIMDKTTNSWQPSVHHNGGPPQYPSCGWHGYLTNGEWISV